MRVWYKGVEPSESESKQLSEIVVVQLKSRDISTVAIYGMSVLGSWLVKILKRSGIRVPFAIDSRHKEIDCEIPLLSTDDSIDDIDAVIVTPYAEFGNIAPLLRERTLSPVISVIELVK
jgi:hypothetical protein